MRKNIQMVITAFLSHKVAHDRTCYTDGTTIYSYQMPIARRTSDGLEVVAYDCGPSRTTKSQIRACQVQFQVFTTVQEIARAL